MGVTCEGAVHHVITLHMNSNIPVACEEHVRSKTCRMWMRKKKSQVEKKKSTYPPCEKSLKYNVEKNVQHSHVNHVIKHTGSVYDFCKAGSGIHFTDAIMWLHVRNMFCPEIAHDVEVWLHVKSLERSFTHEKSTCTVYTSYMCKINMFLFAQNHIAYIIYFSRHVSKHTRISECTWKANMKPLKKKCLNITWLWVFKWT